MPLFVHGVPVDDVMQQSHKTRFAADENLQNKGITTGGRGGMTRLLTAERQSFLRVTEHALSVFAHPRHRYDLAIALRGRSGRKWCPRRRRLDGPGLEGCAGVRACF